MFRFKPIRLLPALALTLAVAGCASLDEKEATRNWTPKQFYDTAHEAVDGKDYDTATKYFELLVARYPFSPQAQQGMIELGYSYYKSGEPDSAISTLDRFLKLFPGHAHADYAWYLKGLTNYNRADSLFDRFMSVDDSQRDPGAARNSFQDFDTLVRKYPDSRYVEDARSRMAYLRDRLAYYEVHVADWYWRRGAYAACTNRARYVIENYASAPATPDALSLMAACYGKLGMQTLESDAQRILALNAPQHPGVKDPGKIVGMPVSGFWAGIGLDR